MKKRTLLPLVMAMSGLMVGCGSGGESDSSTPPVSTKHYWQIIELVRASNPAKECAIFERIHNANGEEKSIIGNIATKNYKIIYHNADGSIIDGLTIQSPPKDGRIMIDMGLVPDNGYVSLEEFDGLNAHNRNSYQIAFQKQYITDMILTVRGSQGNECLKGSSAPLLMSDSDSIVSVAASGQYFQTSASEQKTNGHSDQLDIPVYAVLPATEKKLVTSFSIYENGKYSKIENYGFIDSNRITTKDDDTVDPIRLSGNLSSPFKITISNQFQFKDGTIGVQFEKKRYSWQKVFDQSETYSALPSDDKTVSAWSLKLDLDLQENSWNYVMNKVIDGSDISIDPMGNLNRFQDDEIKNNCGIGKFCLDTNSFAMTDWDLQRTHVKTVNDDKEKPKDVIQTIYASPNTTQVLMDSPTINIGDVSTAKIQLALLKSDKRDSENRLVDMAVEFFNPELISDKNANIDNLYTDLNGVILNDTNRRNLNLYADTLNSTLVIQNK